MVRPIDSERKTLHSRRSLLGSGGLLIAGAAAPACSESGGALAAVRRVVTSEAADGGGEVVFRDAELPAITLNGSTITRLWETNGVPTQVPIGIDTGPTAGNAYREGFMGTSLYLADIPAEGESPEIPMHKEDSLDYIAVLSGEIYLILDDEEILMRSGDVLVQGGNLHTWENRAAEPCRLLVVVLRAERENDPGESA